MMMERILSVSNAIIHVNNAEKRPLNVFNVPCIVIRIESIILNIHLAAHARMVILMMD
jgi:hypothetical protein